MNLFIYSIKDVKSKSFSQPFYETHDEVAKRGASTAVNDPKTTLNKFPDHFELYKIGEWNDKGTITTHQPKLIVPLKDLLKEVLHDKQSFGTQNSLPLQAPKEVGR